MDGGGHGPVVVGDSLADDDRLRFWSTVLEIEWYGRGGFNDDNRRSPRRIGIDFHSFPLLDEDAPNGRGDFAGVAHQRNGLGLKLFNDLGDSRRNEGVLSGSTSNFGR